MFLHVLFEILREAALQQFKLNKMLEANIDVLSLC